MQQIRNAWLKEIGTIKLSCFNGKSVTIHDSGIPHNGKVLTGKSNTEIKSRAIVSSLTGRQRKPSTFTLGELPASEKAEFTL